MSEIEQGKIEKVSVEKLRENRYNPNEMPEEVFDKLKQEYERVGYLQPVLVRPVEEDGEERYEIVDGEHRWRAARQKGVEEINVVVKEMSDEDAKATTLNMNDVKGSDNPIRLAELLKDLQEEGNSTEDLDELLLMEEEEIKQHELLLDAPDEDEVAEELNELDDGENEESLVDISFELIEQEAENLEDFFDCSRQELDTEIKNHLTEETLK